MHAEVIELLDSTSGAKASICPAIGFNCFSFQPAARLGPNEVLWANPGFLDHSSKPTRTGIPVLFPFAGRLRGEQFLWRGQTFKQVANDERGNAIHGFVVNRPWRVVDRSPTAVTGEFHASLDDPSVLEHWPADFKITLRYQLSARQLSLQATVANPDTVDLPFGLGLHPYFRTPLGPRGQGEQCVLQTPVDDQWTLTDLLPTGERLQTDLMARLRRGMSINGEQLDDLFDVNHASGDSLQASLLDNQSGFRLNVSFQASRWPHLVLFTPPHREAVCIEPYTTAPNAFELLEAGFVPGLNVLRTGEEWKATLDISLDDLTP